ncbi:choline ABC transporter ATP-binding protein [Lutibaculum baratangense]|uniref:Trimethylamine N-oxide transport system ATP-binding protein TmoW n=1 Tax=Lutibaculum baratangense AMV1 TaxID=631454 RepID=V4TF88_9HYPH|nr:choline ABC transporter ATP-binding protein [Lutibaculum baratangense]ESR24838.1 L-proline glycine betaine ABC transport system permease protein ProV [Lutibaculum baratangense AMV1]
MNEKSEPIVRFTNVSIVFGDDPGSALPLIDQNKTRGEIQEETGQILGVADATLDVEEGEIVVLMGLSGSGKSTLIRAVNGLNDVARGEVVVRGPKKAINPHSCSRADLRDLRRHLVTMVFQQFALLPWRTVADNVGFGLQLSGVKSAERQRKVEEQLALVGLEGWGDKYVHELSGGMQQRVGLARAFATDAPILLMDEPFSALDPLIRSRLQNELLEVQERLKRTIIFVSHDLDEALKIGNKIAIMEGGRIVQFGTPHDIVLEPANEYVADFVAHMNPLSVLRAQDIMLPVESFAPVSGGYYVDQVRNLVLTDEGRFRQNASELPTVELRTNEPVEGCIAIADRGTSVRDLMMARTVSGYPVFVAEEGSIVGRVGDSEIYAGLLGR